jgi:hypothetical protein
VRDESDYEIEKFERRRQVEVDGRSIWMIAPEDLVLSKLVWAEDSRSDCNCGMSVGSSPFSQGSTGRTWSSGLGG